MKVGSALVVRNEELSRKQWGKLLNALTFVNDQGEVVQCYRSVITRGYMKIPRGAWYLESLSDLDYEDHRCIPTLPKLKFIVKLDDVSKDERFAGQSQAVESMFKYEQGIINRPPGTGKTQIALAFAAQCQTRTLVLVHTRDILRQWINYTENAIPELRGKVGVIQGSTERIGHITIGTVQTIKKFISEKPDSWWKQWGCVIADEAHHVAAPTWEQILNVCPAYYRFGFTATLTRADGMHPSLKFILGPVIHRQRFSSAVKVSVVPIKTKFRSFYRGPFDWGPMVSRLIRDDSRNKQIAKVADDEIANGNSVLILSRRIEHLERICNFMEGDCQILTGKLRGVDRDTIIDRFREGSLSCILATQLADEALDVPRCSRVILTHPGKHEGRIIQQIGRALREHPGKDDAVIYDVVDDRVGVLRRQWNERKRTYKLARIPVKSTGRLKWR
jgi:superfamily II DNA or RNA helicase